MSLSQNHKDIRMFQKWKEAKSLLLNINAGQGNVKYKCEKTKEI